MLPGAQQLTAPTSLPPYKPDHFSSSALSLVSSSVIFLHLEPSVAGDEGRMAQQQQQQQHHHSRPARPGRRNDDTELWFSMPNSARRPHEQEQASRRLEQSAYQATSSRHRARRSASPSRFPSLPLITTSAAINKPLPPSPESEKRKRKPATLRSLLLRRPSAQLDPSHLQPNAHHFQRSASANRSLTPDSIQHRSYHQSSRSMPASPLEHCQAPPNPALLVRAQSAAANYAEPGQYMAYQQPQQQIAVSMNTYFDPQPARGRRTFPDTNQPVGAVPRDSTANRPRPLTWISPTEPAEALHDASEFRLFVEATSGLPDGNLDFDGLSPSSPPHLQGSLFSRGRQNDRIPIPLRNASTGQPSRYESAGGWQGVARDPVPLQTAQVQPLTSSVTPRRESYQRSHLSPGLNNINMELERLGISDEEDPEDELPNYAQSQAEMSARKRKEATDRARELEARWNNSRGWSRR